MSPGKAFFPLPFVLVIGAMVLWNFAKGISGTGNFRFSNRARNTFWSGDDPKQTETPRPGYMYGASTA